MNHESSEKVNTRTTQIIQSYQHEFTHLWQHLYLLDNENSVGCFLDAISLTCEDNGTISVTSAIYGKHVSECCDCCEPDHNDCTMRMVDSDQSDWQTLVTNCNGQEICTYYYTGRVINECKEGYVADYLQIFYTCNQGNSYQLKLELPSPFLLYHDINLPQQDMLFLVMYIANEISVYMSVYNYWWRPWFLATLIKSICVSRL